MTDRTDKLFLALCFIAVYLSTQVWILGLTLPLKALGSFLSSIIIVMCGLHLKFQGDEKK